jgi:TolA-binding protein
MAMVEPFTPWADGDDSDTPEGRRLSELFRAVPSPGALPEVARQRVALRLRRSSRKGAAILFLRVAALGVGVGVAGAAAAHWATARWVSTRAEVEARYESRVSVPASPKGAPSPTVHRTAPPPSAELPPAATLSGGASAPQPAAAPSSRLALEAASLTTALTALKAGGRENAARALSRLDQHLGAFAGGALELEARVARVDALLVLGRRHEARAELARLPLDRVGRKQELRLIRAELRADEDCRAALSDFEQLVAQPLPAPWAERALFGRGACLLKLGEHEAAAQAFDTYLSRFPGGRFAAQIRAQRPR